MIGAIIVGLIGSYILYKTEAQRYSDASAVYGLDVNYTNQGDTPPATAGQDMNFTVVANPPAAWMWGGSLPSQAHINLEFYHDGPVTYKESGFVCGSAGTCTGAPPFPNNGPNFVADARKCVNLTSASINATKITLMTIRYTMGTGSSYIYPNREGSFEVRAHADWEPGPCGTNDWQNCYFVSSATCKLSPSFRTGWPIAAYGGGGLIGGCTVNCGGGGDPGGGDPGDGDGGEGDGDDGNGDGNGGGNGNNHDPRPNSNGGGGSSAKKQSNTLNTIPAPTTQGNVDKQPETDPSPFFDGKLFNKGSKSLNETLGTASVGGKRIPIGLFFISGILAVGVCTLVYWRWMKKPRN